MPKAGKRRPVESTTGLLLNMRTSGNHADMSRALHDKLDQILLGTTASQCTPRQARPNSSGDHGLPDRTICRSQKQPSWEDRAKRFLKAELARADVSYRELADRLKKHGLKETEASVANKISRGTFPATFFLAALVAIGCEAVTLEDI